MNKFKVLLLLLPLFAFLSSCKNDDNPAAPQNPTGSAAVKYVGTFAGASESGSLQLTVASYGVAPKLTAPGSVIAVTGYLKNTLGDSNALSGTFNAANDSVRVTGGGYSLAGVAAGGSLSGEYSGPHGTGAFTLQTSGTTEIKVYVGTFTSQAGNSNGNFNLVVKGGTLTGLAVSESDDKTSLKGNVTGDSLTVFVPGSTSIILAHGSFTDSTHVSASGAYDNHSGDNGIWSCDLSH